MADKSERRMDISKLKVIQTSLQNIKDKHYTVQVGLFGDKAVRKKGQTGVTNAEIGFVQEMGSKARNIVRRSFLWDTFAYHGKELMEGNDPSICLKTAVETLFKKGKVEEYLKQCGIACINLVVKAFETSGWGSWDPNRPSTIAHKKSEKPLIDTGELWQAIDARTVHA